MSDRTADVEAAALYGRLAAAALDDVLMSKFWPCCTCCEHLSPLDHRWEWYCPKNEHEGPCDIHQEGKS